MPLGTGELLVHHNRLRGIQEKKCGGVSHFKVLQVRVGREDKGQQQQASRLTNRCNAAPTLDRSYSMRQLVNWFRAARHANRPATQRNPLTRPAFELLEARNLMSVQYGGGPLLQHVQIETVFYGRDWYNNQALYQNAVQLDNYFKDITHSSYMNLLNEYGVGKGNFQDGVINLSNPTRGYVVDDTEIQNLLDVGIRKGEFDQPTPNRLYFVFTEPNVLVTQQGQDSQHQFLGYHNTFFDRALGPVYYAVIPHPIGNADIPGFNYFDQQTTVSSHELAEAATDPDVRTGWRDYFVTGDEIGDLAEGYFGIVDGYVVQAEYSNYYDGIVLPADAIPLTGGGAAGASTMGQGQPGTEGNVFTPLSSPLQETKDTVQTLAASILSERTRTHSHTDALFAALAQETNGIGSLGQPINSAAAAGLATSLS
jgi:hypothetical protein